MHCFTFSCKLPKLYSIFTSGCSQIRSHYSHIIFPAGFLFFKLPAYCPFFLVQAFPFKFFVFLFFSSFSQVSIALFKRLFHIFALANICSCTAGIPVMSFSIFFAMSGSLAILNLRCRFAVHLSFLIRTSPSKLFSTSRNKNCFFRFGIRCMEPTVFN